MSIQHSESESQLDPTAGYESPPVAGAASAKPPAPEKKRGRGRPRKSAAPDSESDTPSATAPTPPTSPVRKKRVNKELCKISAATLVKIQEGICVTLFGSGWKYNDATKEEQRLVDAWAHYFEVNGIQDIPPGWLIVATTVGYIAPRLADDKETHSRTKKAVGLFGKIKKWANKRAAAKKEKSAAESHTFTEKAASTEPPKAHSGNADDLVKPPTE